MSNKVQGLLVYLHLKIIPKTHMLGSIFRDQDCDILSPKGLSLGSTICSAGIKEASPFGANYQIHNTMTYVLLLALPFLLVLEVQD